MIRQYLSNTNESATISILQKNLELNKALNKACTAAEAGWWDATLLHDEISQAGREATHDEQATGKAK
jgi:hypothetical protein